MTLALFTPGSAAAPCGTIVIPSAIGQDDPAAVTSLNPLIGNSVYNQQSANLIYRPLIWIGRTGLVDPDRSLAQSVTPLENDTRFIVALKPWRWSDGAPVTADDAVFGFELTRDLGPVFAYAGQGGMPDRVASVRALDASHAEIRMKSPTDPQWFTLSGMPVFYPLPRHAWQQAGVDFGGADMGRDALWQRQTDPTLFQVVDGPFKLESFVPGRTISYVPNPLYGGHLAEVGRLVINFLAGGSALHALEAGDVDMAQVRLALWDSVRNLPHTRAVTLPAAFGYESLTFNLRQERTPFFQDPRVRRALTDAADQQTMIDVVYHGASRENRVPIPAEATAFRSEAVRSGHLPVRFDPALAASELDAAGWRMGPDGVRQSAGVRMEFTTLFSGESQDRVQIMQILQQDFRAIGVAMRIRPVDFNQLMAASQGPASGWDAIMSGVAQVGYPDGTGVYDTDGGSNAGGYSNPQMDSLIHASTAPGGLQALYRYQDLFASEQPANILPDGGYRLLVSDRVHGVEEFENPQSFISPEYLSVDDAACHGQQSDHARP